MSREHERTEQPAAPTRGEGAWSRRAVLVAGAMAAAVPAVGYERHGPAQRVGGAAPPARHQRRQDLAAILERYGPEMGPRR